MSRIEHHLRARFVNPLGFSNGWAELALRVPPPLVPSSLMASWLAKGPPGMDWVACSRVVAVSGPRSVWMAPWLTSTTVDHDGEREQDAHRAAHEVDPEVADGRGPATGQAADQGDGHGEADGGGHEVLHGQARPSG